MRRRVLFAGVLFAGSLFLAGCMSVGSKFNYQRVNELTLGEKPAAGYETMFGTPRSIRTRKDPDGNFKQVYYVYGVMYEGARLLALEYKDETVNAYYYATSFNDERSQIDTARFDQVEIGQTKEEVEQLLGKPNGQALCPCYLRMFKDHCDLGHEIWTWNAVSSTGEDTSAEKVYMFVVFDRKGAVVNTLQDQVTLDN